MSAENLGRASAPLDERSHNWNDDQRSGREQATSISLHPSWLWAPLAGLLVLLVFIASARFRGAPTAIPRRPEEAAYIADLFAGNRLAQSFQATQDGLCRVDILLRPTVGESELAFRLWSASREEETIGGRLLCSRVGGTWYTVRFPRIVDSENTEFRWDIGLTNPTTKSIAGLGVADNLNPDGTLYINGRPTASDALFVPYYCNTQTARSLVAEWIEQNAESVPRLLLPGLVVTTAVLFVVILILPPREQPWSIRPLPPLVALASVCLIGVAVAIAVEARLWSRTSVRLRPTAVREAQPTTGPYVAYDFVANLNAPETVVDTPEDWYVGPGWLELDTDRRPTLRMHAPSRVYYTLEVPPGARLRAAAALDPEVWRPDRGDGVLFIVQVTVDSVEETVYYQEIDPKNRPEDRRWHNFEVDLGSYVGETVTLLFITYPMETNAWDQAAWGMPVLLVPSGLEASEP